MNNSATQSKAPTRRRDPKATRAKILASAKLLAANNGALEMAWVAKDAGISHGIAYHHFGSREGLHRQWPSLSITNSMRSTHGAYGGLTLGVSVSGEVGHILPSFLSIRWEHRYESAFGDSDHCQHEAERWN